ncbi:MAG: tetratricopeptide repeat protein [Betaproteobacteria bacterium]|nr:tetratricopeptide repeat protein [Betaproteobacteria bacterium]
MAEAYSNRGLALQALKQFSAALESYDKAIALKPEYAEAYSNKGVVLQELRQFDAAVESYDKAISLRPEFAMFYVNKGVVLQELKQIDAAIYSFDRAIALQPNYDYLFGMWQHAKMLKCDWQDYSHNVLELKRKIQNNEKASPGFPVLSLPISLPEQFKVAQTWVVDKHPYNPSLGPIPKTVNQPKIRIGYFAGEFRFHPVSILTVGLFEHHDKSKFELIAFSFGPDIHDEMKERIANAFDKFLDVSLKSDEEIARISREFGIDIAIDLSGLTQDGRTGIFSFRAAPIQLSYIGYLGTMGANYYDYLIADSTTIPTKSQVFYSEKIVYLPSYQVNDCKQEIQNTYLSRQELNLPSKGFVYCCFNANYKITPPTFDIWIRIIKSVPESVLLLFSDNQSAAENLKLEAGKRGVNPERLIFGGMLNRNAYLARYRTADLFLDTLPYNAGATASDALWVGLPVLTCMGDSFASRVAASLLNAIGVPELITQSLVEYEALAIELATNPAKLKVIKDKLQRNRLTTPLFDTPQFTKNIEAAYTKIYERYQADLPPDHIYIDA